MWHVLPADFNFLPERMWAHISDQYWLTALKESLEEEDATVTLEQMKNQTKRDYVSKTASPLSRDGFRGGAPTGQSFDQFWPIL